MSKKRKELQEAVRAVQSKAEQTNAKITELGACAYGLNNVLNIIQAQFDKIRNVPSYVQRKYYEVKEIHSDWHQQVEKIENDYNSAIRTNAVGAGAGAGLGVGVAALAPTAAMSVATTFGVASTGTPIVLLHGAAATNAALAWIGGGAVATGGSGMAGGSALLALSGPVGWAIAGVAILGSGIMFWKNRSDKSRLEDIFLKISYRSIKSYDLSIVELGERIGRIRDETDKLSSAIVSIGSFGTDFPTMTEEQQYTLGTYVNLMNASAQLLVNPIIGLQPYVKEQDVKRFLSVNYIEGKNIELITYLANMLYGIKTEEKDRKLLAKSFRKDKKFREQMKAGKKDIDAALFNLANSLIEDMESKKKQ